MEPMDPYHHIIPSPIDYIDTWKEMEAAVRDGRVKSIGVSNFNSKQITRLLEFATIKPVINQVFIKTDNFKITINCDNN
jgi:aldehyde reductase